MRTHRLLWQLSFALLGALSIAMLSVLVITETIRNAESVALSETAQILANANHELQQQYDYRVSSDSSWAILPFAAKDISARGITLTVLHSYPEVEGGFYSASGFLGYAFPTHYRGGTKTDVPAPEKPEIENMARLSLQKCPGTEGFARKH